MVNFLQRKIVSQKFQYHAFGGFMEDLIKRSNPSIAETFFE